jgi:hypothetical protein
VTGATSAAFPLVRATYGAALLCAPGAAIFVCTGRPASPAARAVARLLGARHLAQAALTAGAPGAVALGIGAQVDLAHSASMLALAVADRPLRRAGLADGMVAAVFAAAGMADARRRLARQRECQVRPGV